MKVSLQNPTVYPHTKHKLRHVTTCFNAEFIEKLTSLYVLEGAFRNVTLS